MIDEIQHTLHLLLRFPLALLLLFTQAGFPLAEDALVLFQGGLAHLEGFPFLQETDPVGLQLLQELSPVLFLLAQHLLGVVEHEPG